MRGRVKARGRGVDIYTLVASARPPSLRNFSERFELRSQAGTGGMGMVFQAMDRQTGQLVAIKILQGKSETDLLRFNQEATMLSELRHENIVRYVDHGVTPGGDAYLAMEWLQGETLEDRLMRGPLSPASVAVLSARVLGGLAAAHARNIVHRDIKPSNIFLVDWQLDGVRLLDFGIARRVLSPKRFTKMGSTVGTPMYAAPEQARGEPDLDGRADVFSFGSVLYECLVGTPPFSGDTPMEVMQKICAAAPIRLGARRSGLPAELERLVESMLERDRRDRPQDAGKLASAFAALTTKLGLPPEESEDTLRKQPPSPVRQIGDTEQRVMCALMVAFRGPTEGLGDVEKDIERFGGTVDRLADRSLLVTLSGRGMMREQALQLARCALSLRRRLPQAALAIATGRASLLGRAPMGPVLERLGDLLDRLTAGAIAIDPVMARLLPSRFRVDRVGDRRHLIGELPQDGRPRSTRGRPAPFVGREAEMGKLMSIYQDCATNGHPRAALVLGGVGTGKSRLRQELLDAIGRNMDVPKPLVLQVAGELVGGATQYPLLGRIFGSAGINLAPPVGPREVQEAFTMWLRSRSSEAPVLLLMDDVQWADLPCLLITAAALKVLGDRPICVVAFGRPEVDERIPATWGGCAVERLKMAPLPRLAGETLLRHLLPGPTPDIENFVLDRWEGNPFFIEELVEAVRETAGKAPETVLGLVEQRFEEFSPEVRRALRAASLYGDEGFSPDGVVALLGERGRRDLGDCLGILVAREVLQRWSTPDGETVYRFRHRLLREAAYRMLPAPERKMGRKLARAFLQSAGRGLPEFLRMPGTQSTSVAVAT